ncbi:MAG TPA: bacillithiol biosynthesis BshC [Gemmatimonadaceae bacterium]|nr:bacillithiol biosynthesis BshC [Gemmatimonadaceae bacterium]
MSDVDAQMTEPKVVTIPFGGPPLTRAALAGKVPAEWCAHTPRGAEEWTQRARAVLADKSIGDWATALAPAIGATGAAAARLARSATGQGVVVTTGQQPGLFGGPVYTWSKALSALTLADTIEQATGIPVAPVFWAATYDADFVESSASYVILNGDLLRLQQPPPESPGLSMRDTPLGDVTSLVRSLELASGSAVARAALDAAREAYASGQTIGLAYVKLLRTILEPLGIAVLDAGHPAVRRASRSILLRALRRAPEIDAALVAREAELLDKGFEPPVAHVRGLSTVFRYGDRSRLRIPIAAAANVEDDAELEANVVLRPVAERAILPTVGYVGGPGEVAYFAQATAIAQVLGVDAPLVVPRWTGMIIEPHVQRLLERYSLTPDDVRDPHAAESRLVRAQMPATIREALARYASGAELLNDTLRAALASEGKAPLVPDAVIDGARHSIAHRIERLERRVAAALKRREEKTMRDIAIARTSLYPLGKPQERVLNFIPMLARHGQPLLAQMCARASEHAAFVLSGRTSDEADERVATPR